jgi:hypothetical protein
MILGLVGFIGSGKGTAGEIIQQHDFVAESFAGGVKDVAAVMFGWPRNMLEGDTDESRQWRETPDGYWSKFMNRDFTPREALQKIGTEVGRDIFHKDFWVLNLQTRILPWNNYVITDVRFPNEIEWIHSKGGKVIEVQRGDNPIWYKGLKEIKNHHERKAFMAWEKVHESEWAWVGSKLDATIYNDSTKEDFEKKVIKVLTDFKQSDIMNEHLHNGEMNEVIERNIISTEEFR